MSEKRWEWSLWGASFLILLGLSVMVGWWAGSLWLIRGGDHLAPMYFNSAILFFVLGAGITIYLFGYNRLTKIIAFLAEIFVFLLLIELLFRWNLSLDRLFYSIPPYLREQLHPGRCGPNTILAFLFLFASLFLLARNNLRPAHLLAVGVLSGFSFAIATIALWGYLSGITPAYQWGDASRMALFTAIGLTVAALLFLIEATGKLREIDKKLIPVWSGTLVGLILFSTAIAFTRAISLAEVVAVDQLIEAWVEEHGNEMREEIDSVISDLDLLGKKWTGETAPEKKEWRKGSIISLHYLKGLVGVATISENGELLREKWSIVADRVGLEKDMQAIKDKVLQADEPSIYISTFAKSPHMLYVVPSTHSKQHLVGAISMDELLTDLVPDYLKEDVGIEITVNSQPVFETNIDDDRYRKEMEHEVDIPLFNTIWRVMFWPTSKFMLSERSQFPLTAFLFGLIMSLFVGMLTYLALKSLIESRTLASLNMARAAFLAQVSHELRTPLSGVIATVDILENTPMNPKQLHLLDILRTSGQHLLTVINNVLDLAKLEAGKIPLDPSLQDINVIARDVMNLLKPKALEKGLSFVLHCDVPTSLYIDPTRLRQILTNLVGNAIKYTEKGGVVATITYIDQTPKGKLQIHVADTGIGIEKKDQIYLFEKFMQLGKTGAPGSGLGLYITRAIVEIMGGEISFTSTFGVGTTFTVVLPISSPPK